jgi:hypothetical protein
MKTTFAFALLILVFLCLPQAIASQINIAGSSFEEALTKEPISTRTRVAGVLGMLLKSPVHEEITQLAYDCDSNGSWVDDKSCASADLPFANAFVIAGVRWNDLPPFRLASGQASSCKKLPFFLPACNTNETVRFSTQPECWYCLFKAAAVVAKEKQIAGCNAKAGQVRGNLMTRSHFGDLQFLHAMANADEIDPLITQKKILDWIEFGWRVAVEEFDANTRLSDVRIDTIKEHFGCTQWTVSDIYVLGRNDTKMLKHINEIAFGSILHTVQDSFSSAHADRAEPLSNLVCGGMANLPHPGLIDEFHSYGKQDGGKHDAEDERDAMVKRKVPGTEIPLAVAVSRQMKEYVEDRKKWDEVAPFFQCIFTLGESARKSSPGIYLAN